MFVCDVGLAGRADRTTDAIPQVLEEIAVEPPLFYLGGGDYAYWRGDGRFRSAGEALDRWFDQMAPLWMRAPLMAQYGNHEVELEEGLEEWAARFAHPRGSRDGYSYSFDVGAAHFVGLFAPGAHRPRFIFAGSNRICRARRRGALRGGSCSSMRPCSRAVPRTPRAPTCAR